MSNAASPQLNADWDEWDHLLEQLERQWPVREQVSTVLSDASAAFAAQFTRPDAYRYAEACDRLTKFLAPKPRLDDSEQKLVRVSHVWSRSLADSTVARADSSSMSRMS